MLNISKNKINKNIEFKNYKSLVWISKKSSNNIIIKILYVTFGFLLILLFFPWTQNIRSDGYVTTLNPDQRPQTLHSVVVEELKNGMLKKEILLKKETR